MIRRHCVVPVVSVFCSPPGRCESDEVAKSHDRTIYDIRIPALIFLTFPFYDFSLYACDRPLNTP